jgi:hypothetical protein
MWLLNGLGLIDEGGVMLSMWYRRTAMIAGAVALTAVTITAPAQAAQPSADKLGLIPYDGPIPEGISLTETRDIPGEMTQKMSDGIWEIELAGHGRLVNTYEWDASTETLLIYTSDGEDEWAPLLEAYLPDQQVKLVHAEHSKAEVDVVMATIVKNGGQLADGDRIVTAIPAKDGSSIALGIDSSRDVRRLSSVSIAKTLATEIPLTIEVAPEVTPTRRSHSYLDTYWLGGASMSTPHARPGWIHSCTTGFAIGHLTSGADGMLSAEHCGRGKPGADWYYGHDSSTISARSLGNFQGFLSTAGFDSDTALWTGGNLSKMIPAILTGGHNDVNYGEFVRGGNYPAVGTDVCYTGSESGNICRNEVLFQGVTICYAIAQCYPALSWTSQRDSVEAAGHGDSGGPVYQSVSSKAMASGVISGIVGGSSTCSGEPGATGGRQCSPVALFAPVVAALGSGGNWGLSYTP